ncbi:MAG: hypothetical protein ABSG68_16410 [Thermoguttaceae bacterium]|jgi:hypothetical protein
MKALTFSLSLLCATISLADQTTSTPVTGTAATAAATVTVPGRTISITNSPLASGTTPTNLTLTAQKATSVSLSWAAADGAASYKIYRNGSVIASGVKGTTFTDGAATNAINPAWTTAATPYTYTVSAVGSSGTESAQAPLTCWMYHNGVNNIPGDFSSTVQNYKDTMGVPQSGTTDISITSKSKWGYTQPFSGAPICRDWTLDINAFKYMTLDLKPTLARQSWNLSINSRVPPGDVYNKAQVILPGKYGPAPVVGKWATYKVPLADLAIGTGSFVGSISGTTLTVTRLISGVTVQPTMFISGPGIAAGTYVAAFGSGSGGAGTYTVNNSQTVRSETIHGQRTNMYKFWLRDNQDPGVANNLYYLDNVGFTAN